MSKREFHDPVLSHAGRRLLDRRGFLTHAAGGLGGIALANLLADEGLLLGGERRRFDPPSIRRLR